LQNLPFDKPAGHVSIMVPPISFVNVIADVPVVIHAPAFTVPIADLPDLLPFVVKRDPPYLFMPESEFPPRRRNMDRNQVDYTVRILGSVMSE
jgi:hypothetical protein